MGDKESHPSASAPSVLAGELQAEKDFIEIGKTYQKSGEDLTTFVRERLVEWRKAEAQRIDREERAESRRLLLRERELAEAQEKRKHDAQKGKARKPGDTEVVTVRDEDSSDSQRRVYRVPVPKYDGTQEVVAYLDLFEAVMKRNEEPVESWPLFLSTAVSGTKLAGSVCLEDFESYQGIRRELLLAFGTTQAAAWRDLLEAKQSSSETFRQFCMRTHRLTMRWVRLALGTDKLSSSVTPDDVLTEVSKQVVLGSAPPGLSAYLLRNCNDGGELGAFADVGTTYQSSYGAGRQQRPQAQQQHQSQQQQHQSQRPKTESKSSAQVFSVTVDELSKLSLEQRREQLRTHRLCFNCLKPGHVVARCPSKPQCTKCNRRHHTLLHEDSASGITAYSCQMASGTPAIHLMTAVGEVKGDKRAKVRMFLDLGSQASFVSSELVQAIKPRKVGRQRMAVRSFGGIEAEADFDLYELSVTGEQGSHVFRAYERSSLDLRIERVSQECIDRWQSRGVQLSDQLDAKVPVEPHVLLGADVANALLLNKCQFESEFVWKTELGWVLSGPSDSSSGNSNSTSNAAVVSVGCVQSREIERLFQLEEPVSTTTDLPVFPLEKDGDVYEVGLLWKSEKRPADNYAQAMATAKLLLQKLNKTGTKAAYDDVLLREYTELGAVEVDPDPFQEGYYMPHHAVFKEESTSTKTRVVFNASASRAGCESLNALLDPGPSLLPSLAGLLLRFREKPVAVQSDIRKAFFMIRVQESDRRYLRFLWPDDAGVMRVWRLARVPFGVSCSPFLLTAVLRHHIEAAMANVSPAEQRMLQLLRDSLYVDDCVTSVDSADMAQSFKVQSIECLSTAGMDLRKWRSNVSISEDGMPEEGKVLGVVWNTSTDQLRLPVPDGKKEPTSKRRLLNCVASFFDPLGFASPYIVRGKMHLQQLWKLGVGWDDPLPDSLHLEIGRWWGERYQLSNLALPRYLGVTDAVTVHLFTDASESGMGCCIYVTDTSGSRLIFSKSKVAPTRQETIARLELQAAFSGARTLKFVSGELRHPVKEFHAWSDSLTTLQWIAGPPHRWKTFVANRVKEIQDVASELGVTWHHCPGKDNPADLASRGSPVKSLSDALWQHGPEWLADKSAWPAERAADTTAELEVRVNAVSTASTAEEYRWWTRLSSWDRTVAVAKRLLSWRPKSRPSLSTSELEVRGKALVIRKLQAEMFPAELECLKAGQPLARDSKLLQFRPFLDEDGVMRIGGRLGESALAFSAKHPVLLSKHHTTEVLLRHLHSKQMHQGVETVLAVARQDFWILGDRRMLRAIQNKCVTCRRYSAKSADEVSGALPRDRVSHERPFGLCGIDYAGPLFLKDGGKAWIALFTCGTTRAVHLELVTSLEKCEFILAYRRFCARWGEPKRIRSDNGTTFRAAAKELKVDWRFNPPAAPWFGGFFERLVGAVKRPLVKVLGKALAKEVELRTLLCEVEAAVNNRPLTHLGSDDDEVPLTPALLCGKFWSAAETASESDAEVTASQLQQRHQYTAMLAQHVEKRWREEYVSTLSSYHAGQSRSLKLGDVVLIVDDKKRQLWRMARVLKLLPGKDGRVRVAEIRVAQPNGERAVLLRPVRRLVPLEVLSGPEVEVPAQVVSPVADIAIPPIQPVTGHEQQVQEQPPPAQTATPSAMQQYESRLRSTRTRAIQRPIRYR